MYYGYSTELYHHGVKGQKWGYRRWQYENGSLTPEGRIHYGYGNVKTAGEYKLNVKRNRAANYAKSMGKALGISLLAAFIPGVATVYNASLVGDFATSQIDKRRDYVKKEGEYETVDTLKTKQPPASAEEAVAKVNPRTSSKQAGKVNNCVACSLSMEMQRRGYDVMARSMGNGVSYSKEIPEIFKNPKTVTVNCELKGNSIINGSKWREEAYNALCNELESQGDGARGITTLVYEDGKCGHAMYYEVKDGRAYIYDGQQNKVFNNGSSNSSNPFLYANPKLNTYTRLDNLELNEDKICEYVRSRS